jgi:hypothetical protein
MTYHHANLRSAITAIAAVLALSSTPLFAQDAGTADTAAEAPPVAEPDPLAPEPTATEAATETTTEPPPATRPKVETGPAKSSRPAASRTARTIRKAATLPTVAPVTEVPVAAPPSTVSEARPAAEPTAPPPVVALPAAEPTTPIPAELAAAADALMTDERLQLSGGAAAGLLAMGGMAMALRRRRRRKDEERLEESKWAIIEASPGVDSQAGPEPALARTPTPMHDPVPSPNAAPDRAPVTKLANGFDLSGFGPHVQAAYRGPTPDNPSVSLEYRLRRASVMDRKELDTAEAAVHAAKVPTKGNWESRTDAGFLFRRAGSNNSAKQEYQR